MAPITFDGDEVTEVTIDGEQVSEITMDGDLVWRASQTIDDFEDGDRSGWDVPSSTGGDQIVSPGLNGTDHAWEHTGFREAHLAGANTVDRGPQPGDRFEFWFNLTNASGSSINRFEFGCSQVGDGDLYRIEFERETSDNEFQIEKIAGGSQSMTDTDPGHAVAQDTVYRCEVNWNHGDNQITAQLFDANGNADSAILSITDTEYSQPGVCLFTNSNSTVVWDQMRITDTA